MSSLCYTYKWARRKRWHLVNEHSVDMDMVSALRRFTFCRQHCVHVTGHGTRRRDPTRGD